MAEDNINFNDFNDEYANLTIPELQQSQESQAENFIVGGQHGIIDRAPWTCRIRLFSAHVCGGAIISQQHVLTSAHCVVMPGMGIYAIIAGSSTGNGAPTTVTRIILHPEYHSRTLQHDIAVLSLIRPLTPHRTLAVARLPPIGVPPQPSSVGLISGWYTIYFQRVFKRSKSYRLISFQGYDDRKQCSINAACNTNIRGTRFRGRSVC